MNGVPLLMAYTTDRGEKGQEGRTAWFESLTLIISVILFCDQNPLFYTRTICNGNRKSKDSFIIFCKHIFLIHRKEEILALWYIDSAGCHVSLLC